MTYITICLTAPPPPPLPLGDRYYPTRVHKVFEANGHMFDLDTCSRWYHHIHIPTMVERAILLYINVRKRGQERTFFMKVNMPICRDRSIDLFTYLVAAWS